MVKMVVKNGGENGVFFLKGCLFRDFSPKMRGLVLMVVFNV